MLNIIGKKNIYFLISLIVIVPGLVSLLLFGLKLSIEFTGGSRMTLTFPNTVTPKTVESVKNVFEAEKLEVSTIQSSGKDVIVRAAPINDRQDVKLIADLHKSLGDFKQESFESIGPVIGSETTTKALYSVLLAAALIVIYIAISFRKVPKPVTSWRFGISAIIALLHDVLVVLGIFSILGHFFGVEVDSLFITGLLTVIGFSVHDTIVVFDRIRENLLRVNGQPFATIVNNSILQTIVRSLNTSFTAILVLLTLLFFGGDTVRWFVVALLIGIASGTYSSIFNAAPLLVTWHEWDQRRKLRIKNKE